MDNACLSKAFSMQSRNPHMIHCFVRSQLKAMSYCVSLSQSLNSQMKRSVENRWDQCCTMCHFSITPTSSFVKISHRCSSQQNLRDFNKYPLKEAILCYFYILAMLNSIIQHSVQYINTWTDAEQRPIHKPT